MDLEKLNNRLLEIDEALEALKNEKDKIKQQMIDENLELKNYMIMPTNSYSIHTELLDTVPKSDFGNLFKIIPETVKVKSGKHNIIMKKFPGVITVSKIIYKLMKKK